MNAADLQYQTTTRRRLSQFGVRELLALTACLAATLALYRGGGLFMLNALPLTFALFAVARQSKRVDRWSDVPFEFTVSAVAIGTLALEIVTAWLWGSGRLYGWWPQHVETIGSTLSTVFTVTLCLRVFLLLWSMVEVLVNFVGWMARSPTAWGEQRVRFDVLGRFGIAILAVPFWFSFPIRDMAAVRAAEKVGADAITMAALAHRDGVSNNLPYISTETRSLPLRRLGVTEMQERRSQRVFYVHDCTRAFRYQLYQLGSSEWEVRLSSRTMRRAKVIGIGRVR